MTDAAHRRIAPALPSVDLERAFLILLLAVTAARVVTLTLTPLSLHPDEAQYWAWSRELAWGYFSKPPMIAWIIAATTSVFGNAEWAARLASPFLHAGAAGLLYLLGKRLYDARVGAFAGIAWLFIPSVWLSSVLISTDAALLPLVALALVAFHSLMQKPTYAAGALLGVAIGLGVLAKYAMLYVPMGMAVAALWLPQARAAVLSKPMLLAGAAALVVLAPNLIWNAQNDFATLGHTVANANFGGGDDLVNVDEAGGFFIDQIGMAGLWTIAFFVLVVMIVRKRATLSDADRLLIAFAAPPLIIIFAQSLISRAHANWAAAAYPALVVLTTAWLADPARRAWLWGAIGVHVAGWLAFTAIVISPTFADSIGMANALKRLRGWDATAQAVEARLAQSPAPTILVDHRHLYFQLKYQWRDRPDLQNRVRMWVLRGAPNNHAELDGPLRASDPTPALTVQMSLRYKRFLADDFARFTDFGVQTIALGGGKTREIGFGLAQDFTPKPRTPALLQDIGP